MTAPILPEFFDRQRLILNLADVKPAEKLLLWTLNHYAGSNSEAWPAQETLALNVGLSDRQVRNLTDSLVERGLISVRRASPNRYRLNWNRISETGNPLPVSSKPNRKPTSGTNRKPTSGLVARNRKPASYKHPLKNTQKNTQAAVASLKQFSWTIKPDELKDHAKVESRFRQAVKSNWMQEADQLRFHTLAVYVRRQSGIKNPGALMTSLLRDEDWKGTNADEDAARAAIRSLTKPKANFDIGNLGAKLAATVPEGYDDDPIC